jgi:hypothetical protein
VRRGTARRTSVGRSSLWRKTAIVVQVLPVRWLLLTLF